MFELGSDRMSIPKMSTDSTPIMSTVPNILLPQYVYCLWLLQRYSFFSSPEPSGSQGELIVYPCSVVRPSSVVRRPSVRRPQFSKIFFSETAWPIKAKFYMKHLWEGGTNVYINNPGHMTKMAAMPIYGKNPSKIFFSGTTGPISTKLGMKHR